MILMMLVNVAANLHLHVFVYSVFIIYCVFTVCLIEIMLVTSVLILDSNVRFDNLAPM